MKVRAQAQTIGVLGGTGPAATAYLHTLLVRTAQRDHGAIVDTDFPAMIVFNTPLPATAACGWEADDSDCVREAVIEAACALATAGADIIVPACNTIDAFGPVIAANLSIPMLSLPALAATEARRRRLPCVGVLSSRRARELGLHTQALAAFGVRAVNTTPSEQETVDTLIGRLMGAPATARDRIELASLGAAMRGRGAKAVIIGCTELSLSGFGFEDTAWIDATSLAASSALRFAYQDLEVRACA
jgi:aspartate racemase